MPIVLLYLYRATMYDCSTHVSMPPQTGIDFGVSSVRPLYLPVSGDYGALFGSPRPCYGAARVDRFDCNSLAAVGGRDRRKAVCLVPRAVAAGTCVILLPNRDNKHGSSPLSFLSGYICRLLLLHRCCGTEKRSCDRQERAAA